LWFGLTARDATWAAAVRNGGVAHGCQEEDEVREG
jgi:hypothetical protein